MIRRIDLVGFLIFFTVRIDLHLQIQLQVQLFLNIAPHYIAPWLPSGRQSSRCFSILMFFGKKYFPLDVITLQGGTGEGGPREAKGRAVEFPVSWVFLNQPLLLGP